MPCAFQGLEYNTTWAPGEPQLLTYYIDTRAAYVEVRGNLTNTTLPWRTEDIYLANAPSKPRMGALCAAFNVSTTSLGVHDYQSYTAATTPVRISL